MERKMRRFKQILDEGSSKEILRAATNGVLSLVDRDGEPYGVPLSFVYDGDRRIYFHSAVMGHKIECIEHDSRCSFCVVDRDMIVPEEFTTYFRSVIVEGAIHAVATREEKLEGLALLCEKYSPGVDSAAEIAKCIGHVTVLRLDIDSFTGKEAIELVRQRTAGK